MSLLQGQQPSVEAAWSLLAKGQRPEAVQVLRGIIKDHPADADARLLLGSILAEDGKRPEVTLISENSLKNNELKSDQSRLGVKL